MKNLIGLLLLLFIGHLQANIPSWIKVRPELSEQTTFVSSNISPSVLDFVTKYIKPHNTEKLVGLKVDLSISSNSTFSTGYQTTFDTPALEAAYKSHVTRHYFQSGSIDLDMNEKIGFDAFPLTDQHHIYSWGHVKTSPDHVVPIEEYLFWKDTDTGKEHRIAIKGSVFTYNNGFLSKNKNFSIKSESEQPLVRGILKMTKHNPLSAHNDEFEIAIVDGMSHENNRLEAVHAGHYRVELTEPEDCNLEIDEDYVLTPEILSSDDPIAFEIVCSYAYDTRISGTITTKDEFGMDFHFDLNAWEVITHDDDDQFDSANLFIYKFDDQGYPLGDDSKRITLPMKLPYDDRRLLFSSWSSDIEVKDAYIKEHYTGDYRDCRLEEGSFGFVRIQYDTVFIPGYTSKAGAYPQLEASFQCNFEGTWMPIGLSVGPVAPLADGGWMNQFNLNLSPAAEEKLASSESFVEFFYSGDKIYESSVNTLLDPLVKASSSSSSSNLGRPAHNAYKIKLEFDGGFIRKEFRRPGTTGEGSNENPSEGDYSQQSKAYIFTDTAMYDDYDNVITIEVVSLSEEATDIDYELQCLKPNSSHQLVDKGVLPFRTLMPPHGMARKEFKIDKPDQCESFKVEYDTVGKYPAWAIEPAKSIDISKNQMGGNDVSALEGRNLAPTLLHGNKKAVIYFRD